MRVRMLHPAHVAGHMVLAGEDVETSTFEGLALVDGGLAELSIMPVGDTPPTTPADDAPKRKRTKSKVRVIWPKKGGKA